MSDFLRPHGLYVAHQAPLSMGFPRQEYWGELVAISCSRGSSQSRDQTPTLQMDSLLTDLTRAKILF